MTHPPDGEQLRDSWRALADDTPDVPQVDDEAIWRAVAGEGSEAERLAVVDALARDPAVAESWRVAPELQRELTEREPNWSLTRPGERSAGAPLWRNQWLALAALLFLALGWGLWHSGGPPSSPEGPVFRDGSEAELRSNVPEGVGQPRERVILSWFDAGSEASKKGTHYTLRVLRPNLEPLVVLRRLSASSVQIPEDQLRQVAVGERLLWQVTAHRPDGQVITSQTFFLDLAPAALGSTPPNNPQQEEP